MGHPKVEDMFEEQSLQMENLLCSSYKTNPIV